MNPRFALISIFLTAINITDAGKFSTASGQTRISSPRSHLLSLRGGFDPVQVVSKGEEHHEHLSSLPKSKINFEDIDHNLLEGDIARLAEGQVLRPEDFEVLAEQQEAAAYQFQMTQQFLVLQNVRIQSQMPGGTNCSYADSWFTGEMWDRTDDDSKWTRSAWLQCQRAESWEEMPPVWKRILRESWEELQEFMALLTLPDGGASTAKFRAHAEAWEVDPRRPSAIARARRRRQRIASARAPDAQGRPMHASEGGARARRSCGRRT